MDKENNSADLLATALRDVVEDSISTALEPLRQEVQKVRSEMHHSFVELKQNLAEVRGELTSYNEQD